jgi:hypothetical protein
MPVRVRASLVVSCSFLLLAGCRSRTEPGPKEGPPPADPGKVTLHVKGMTERLGLA